VLTQWKELIDMKEESELCGDDEEGTMVNTDIFNCEFNIL
jgi:hypothetical protein